MKNFDYMEFNDDYGYVFSAEKYTKDDAKKIVADETEQDIKDINQPEKVWVRYTINGGWDFDYQPCYITCEEDDRGSFPCWRIGRIK